MLEWFNPPFVYESVEYNHNNSDNGLYIYDLAKRNSNEIAFVGYFWKYDPGYIADDDYSIYTYNESTELLTKLIDGSDLLSNLETAINNNSPDSPRFTYKDIYNVRVTCDILNGILIHFIYRIEDTLNFSDNALGSATYYIDTLGSFSLLFESFSNGFYIYFWDATWETGAQANPKVLGLQHYAYIEQVGEATTKALFQRVLDVPTGYLIMDTVAGSSSFGWLTGGTNLRYVESCGTNKTEIIYEYNNVSSVQTKTSVVGTYYNAGEYDEDLPVPAYKLTSFSYSMCATVDALSAWGNSTFYFNASLWGINRGYIEYVYGEVNETADIWEYSFMNVDFGKIGIKIFENSAPYKDTTNLAYTHYLHKNWIYYPYNKINKNTFLDAMPTYPVAGWEAYPEDYQEFDWNDYGAIFVYPENYALAFAYTDYPDTVYGTATILDFEEYFFANVERPDDWSFTSIDRGTQISRHVFVKAGSYLYCLEYFPKYKVEPSSITIDENDIHIGGKSVADLNTVSGTIVTSGIINPYAVYVRVDIPPITTESGDYSMQVGRGVYNLAPSGIAYVKQLDYESTLLYGTLLPFRALVKMSGIIQDISYNLPEEYTSASVELAEEDTLLCGDNGVIYALPVDFSGEAAWENYVSTNSINTSLLTMLNHLYLATPGAVNSVVRSDVDIISWEKADYGLPEGITVLDIEEEWYADR